MPEMPLTVFVVDDDEDIRSSLTRALGMRGYRVEAHPSAAALLAETFGLSPAEVDLVRQLLAGHALKDTARDSGRSEHTVRNQTKSILAKTGAPGQVDLVRLVAFLLSEDTSHSGAVATGDVAGRHAAFAPAGAPT